MKTIIIKTILIALGLTLSLTSVNAQLATANEVVAVAAPAPIMTWEKKFVDFGEVKKGEKRETVFHFTNTGNAPLEIDLVSACDCTTTDYPRRPIAPGESGKIAVVFDSSEKEESETIDIDIFLKNEDPETGAPIIEMLQYKYELIK